MSSRAPGCCASCCRGCSSANWCLAPGASAALAMLTGCCRACSCWCCCRCCPAAAWAKGSVEFQGEARAGSCAAKGSPSSASSPSSELIPISRSSSPGTAGEAAQGVGFSKRVLDAFRTEHVGRRPTGRLAGRSGRQVLESAGSRITEQAAHHPDRPGRRGRGAGQLDQLGCCRLHRRPAAQQRLRMHWRMQRPLVVLAVPLRLLLMLAAAPSGTDGCRQRCPSHESPASHHCRRPPPAVQRRWLPDAPCACCGVPRRRPWPAAASAPAAQVLPAAARWGWHQGCLPKRCRR